MQEHSASTILPYLARP